MYLIHITIIQIIFVELIYVTSTTYSLLILFKIKSSL